MTRSNGFAKKEKEMARRVKPKYVVGPDVDLDREVVLLKSGERLTSKLAEKMARDAIKQVVGRPSLSGVAIESPQLKLRIPVKLKKAIEKEAKRRGETTSTVVREVLQERFLQQR
jgi:hypothetical protein